MRAGSAVRLLGAGLVAACSAAAGWAALTPGVASVVVSSAQTGGAESGSVAVLIRDVGVDAGFESAALFVACSIVGGALIAAVGFVRSRRTPATALAVAATASLSGVIAVALGQVLAGLRFDGPGAVGDEFLAAPAIVLDGANLVQVANHPPGVIGLLAPWVLVLVWPIAATFCCAVIAAVAHLPAGDRLGAGVAP